MTAIKFLHTKENVIKFLHTKENVIKFKHAKVNAARVKILINLLFKILTTNSCTLKHTNTTQWTNRR